MLYKHNILFSLTELCLGDLYARSKSKYAVRWNLMMGPFVTASLQLIYWWVNRIVASGHAVSCAQEHYQCNRRQNVALH